MSVANTVTGRTGRPRLDSSVSSIAIEYASSPVEQPATQARIGSSSAALSSSFGSTSRSSASNALRSRKNWVTPISRSSSRAFGSSAALARKRRYAIRSGRPLTCRRRSIRRSTVARL